MQKDSLLQNMREMIGYLYKITFILNNDQALMAKILSFFNKQELAGGIVRETAC